MALTIGTWNHVAMGNKKAAYALIEGDGTATTILTPLAVVEMAIVTLNTAGGNNDTRSNLEPLSLSTTTQNQVTYANAVVNGKYHTLFVVGH